MQIQIIHCNRDAKLLTTHFPCIRDLCWSVSSYLLSTGLFYKTGLCLQDLVQVSQWPCKIRSTCYRWKLEQGLNHKSWSYRWCLEGQEVGKLGPTLARCCTDEPEDQGHKLGRLLSSCPCVMTPAPFLRTGVLWIYYVISGVHTQENTKCSLFSFKDQWCLWSGFCFLKHW